MDIPGEPDKEGESTMEYMSIITKSLRNAWEYKFLWLFGLFAGLAHGGSGGGGRGNVHAGNWDIEPGLLVLLIAAALFIGLIFFLLSVWSEAALIHGIFKKETSQETDFSDCSRAGGQKYWRIFGIRLLVIVVAFGTVLLTALFLIPAFLAAVPLGILLALFLVPGFFAMMFILTAIEGWAMRFAVIRDLNWDQAIREAWRLFQKNVAETIGVAFSSFLPKILAMLTLVFAMLILALPAILLGVVTLGLALIPLAFLGLVILVAAGAYLGTFGSSVWTLGFMKLAGGDEALAAEDDQA